MECIIEEHCEGLKKRDRRARQQRHAILSILKQTVAPAPVDHPVHSVPNRILPPYNSYAILFIICIICYLHCSIPSKASRKPRRSIFMFGWLVLHLRKNICLVAWNLDFSAETHSEKVGNKSDLYAFRLQVNKMFK